MVTYYGKITLTIDINLMEDYSYGELKITNMTKEDEKKYGKKGQPCEKGGVKHERI